MKRITTQETRVLNLISQGYSSQEIALALGITTNTVETHRKNLLAKLAAKNAAELVRVGIQAGIIKINPLEELERPSRQRQQPQNIGTPLPSVVSTSLI